VADVLRSCGAAYLAARAGRVAAVERSVLKQLTACRTAALGGHTWACDTCGHTRVAYNSCRNRHCPTCGGPTRARWLDRLQQDLLPVSHFHLVFTIPHELSRLTLANRRAVYGLLFQSAWEALAELAADPRHLGAQVGAVMVLHTWGQNLDHHPHVHCVVPGGGLSPDGQRWIASHPKFFLPVVALSRLFRGKFLDGLKRLHRQHKLQLADKLLPLFDAQDFAAWLTPLSQKDWVVYVQPPVSAQQGPEAVLKYLARYVAGAAISDGRLLEHAAGRVSFRAKNYRQGRQRQTLSLPEQEFVRRFLLHVLPRGFVRVRYYGLLANTQRAALIARCRELLGAATPAVAEPASRHAHEGDSDPAIEPPLCPACGRGRLLLIDSQPRPAWCDVRGLPCLAAEPLLSITTPRGDSS
jgi:hypothetical protein